MTKETMMINTFIFDLDGVIVDTAKYHYLAWKKLAEQLNLQFTIRDNELLKGVSRRRSLEIILELNGVRMDDEEIEKYCAQKNEIYVEYIDHLKEEEILPGVKEFIDGARKEGVRIALGSASKNSRKILDKLKITNLFDAVIDGTKVSKAKPDPEVFLKGCYELGSEPEQCVVFEDSLAGIMAAHNGGMKAIGVSNNEIRQYCDYFIPGFVNVDAAVLKKKVAGG